MIDSEHNKTKEELERGTKTLGEGLPQILHNRARESSQELHKLLLSFSSAALAVYFVALTAKNDLTITFAQTVVLFFGFLFMGTAVLGGLIAYYADMKQNYYKGSAMQAKEEEKQNKLYKSADMWRAIQRKSVLVLNFYFFVGVLAAMVYVDIRLMNI